MSIPALVTICLLGAAVIYLLARVLAMRATAREIGRSFYAAVQNGSNTPVTVSTSDRAMRELAIILNVQLDDFKKKRHMYEAGDRRIKDGISNVAHDLRTPLTAIVGYLELLENEPDPQTAARYVRIIRERAQAMHSLTGELFDWAIAAHPEHKEELVPVRLQDALAESIAVNYPAFNEKGVRPIMQFPDESVVRNADRKSLGRIFGNLMTNALRHGEGDLTISLHPSGEVDFSNAAPGLDPLDVERLFDRFYTVRGGNGSTGLGLSIARMLSEQMNGSMDATLKDGILTVRVMLPEQAPGTPKPARTPNGD